MSSHPDRELDAWMADWQDEAAAPADVLETIRRRARRRTLGLALLTAGELLFAAAVLTFLARFALAHRHPIDLATMAGLALLVLCAPAFALWNRHGIWRPSAQTTTAFLDLSIARCRRRLRTVRFGYALLTAEVLLFIPWIAFHLDTSTTRSWLAHPLAAYGYLTTVAALTLLALAALARRTRRELTSLTALQDSLAESGFPRPDPSLRSG